MNWEIHNPEKVTDAATLSLSFKQAKKELSVKLIHCLVAPNLDIKRQHPQGNPSDARQTELILTAGKLPRHHLKTLYLKEIRKMSPVKKNGC